MAATVDATIAGSDFAAGWMPDISPITGEPATERRLMRVSYTPPAVMLLILAGFVGLIVGILVCQKTVKGPVPMAPQHDRAGTGAGWWVAGISGYIAILAIIVAVNRPTNSAASSIGALLFVGGLLGLVAGLIMVLVRRGGDQLRGKVFDDAVGVRWVILKAHPNFATAMASWYAQRAVSAPPQHGQPFAPPPPAAPGV